MTRSFLEWLGGTPWSVALLESLWVWPLVESTHVLTIAVFVGTAMMVDLRLMGVTFGSGPTSDFTGRMLKWTRGGFVVLAVTGLLIFYSQPIRYYHNIFFRLKMLLLIVGGINAFLFHGMVHRKVAEWDLDGVPPRAARISGAVSITVWLVIVVCGRLIAYNWFDCDIQPQPDWVNRAASCVLPSE